MTPFERCLLMAILGSCNNIYLATLISVSKIDKQRAVEFLDLFERPNSASAKDFLGSEMVTLSYHDIYENMKEIADDGGVLLGGSRPVPVQLQVALHLANHFPPLYTRDKGKSYLEIGQFLLIFAKGALENHKYARSKSVAKKMIEVLEILFSQWKKQLEVIESWEEYDDKVDGVDNRTREFLLNVRPILRGAPHKKLPWVKYS